jgi:hypothetical protein
MKKTKPWLIAPFRNLNERKSAPLHVFVFGRAVYLGFVSLLLAYVARPKEERMPFSK